MNVVRLPMALMSKLTTYNQDTEYDPDSETNTVIILISFIVVMPSGN